MTKFRTASRFSLSGNPRRRHRRARDLLRLCLIGTLIAGHIAMFPVEAQSEDVKAEDVKPEESMTHAKAPIPDGTVRLISAPHVGSTICEIPDRMALKFIKYARHGPHQFAKVQVLDGSCEGKEGYIPVNAMDRPS